MKLHKLRIFPSCQQMRMLFVAAECESQKYQFGSQINKYHHKIFVCFSLNKIISIILDIQLLLDFSNN